MQKLKIIKLLINILAVFAFAGCLKDTDYEDGLRGIDIDDNAKVIEIAGPLDGFANVDLIGSDADTTVNIVLVRLASGKPAPNDIQVTLALDPTVVNDFNTAHNTSYVVPAASLYTIPSLTVTIPKGSTTGYLKLTSKPNVLFGTPYALGVKLVSVASEGVILSGNFNKQVVGLTIRNKYDGAYTMTGSLSDASVTAITAKSPAEVHLVTTGTNTVYLYNAGASNPGWYELFPIRNSGAESAYGSFTPEFAFDASNNVISVVNAYGQPSGNGRSARIDPSGVNKWDPATKTLRVKWFMDQAPLAPRTSFDYVFTYTGTR